MQSLSPEVTPLIDELLYSPAFTQKQSSKGAFVLHELRKNILQEDF